MGVTKLMPALEHRPPLTEDTPLNPTLGNRKRLRSHLLLAPSLMNEYILAQKEKGDLAVSPISGLQIPSPGIPISATVTFTGHSDYFTVSMLVDTKWVQFH